MADAGLDAGGVEDEAGEPDVVRSASIFALASVPISSRSSRSATFEAGSRPSVERSDSSRRSESCRDKAVVCLPGPNCAFVEGSCTVVGRLSGEDAPADGAPEDVGTSMLRGDVPESAQLHWLDHIARPLPASPHGQPADAPPPS